MHDGLPAHRVVRFSSGSTAASEQSLLHWGKLFLSEQNGQERMGRLAFRSQTNLTNKKFAACLDTRG